jgi:tRNA (adenine57-N1/adenine58-N1)-methyltransferase catalytic subunit
VVEPLILLDANGRKHVVSCDGGMVQIPNLGTFDSRKLQANIGGRIEIAARRFVVLRASRQDLSDTMPRGPQTIAAKDIAAILYGADLEPGARAIEAGSGSGALTMALARAVGPSGRVVSYDFKAASQSVARTNVAAAGLNGVVEFREGDIRHPIPETEMDAMVLDIPDPWSAVSTAWSALKAGGHLVGFSPNTEQVKQTVDEIRRKPFVDIRTIELIEREIEVREGGVRPSFAPLGHTGYLTFARKVRDTF